MAKVDMLHVPYRGAAPAMQDLLAGQIHMIFDNIPGALAQSRAGKVRAARRHLGRAHAGRARRAGDRRDAAGLRHQLVDHAHRPGEAAARVVTRAVGAVEEGDCESDDLKAKFLDLAATAIWRSPADTLAYRDAEEARLAPIIKASGARDRLIATGVQEQRHIASTDSRRLPRTERPD